MRLCLGLTGYGLVMCFIPVVVFLSVFRLKTFNGQLILCWKWFLIDGAGDKGRTGIENQLKVIFMVVSLF